MRVEPFRRFTQKACVTFTTGSRQHAPHEHPPHRIWTFSGRAVQSYRTPGRKTGAQPSPRPPGVRRTSHVFRTSYEAVDRELPALLKRTKPDVLVMFGLAARTRHVRIETRARNAYSRVVPDAAGHAPRAGTIAPGAAASLALRIPAQRLVKAARSTGVESRAVARRRPLPLQLSLLARDRGRRAPGRAEGRGLRARAEGPRDTARAARR